MMIVTFDDLSGMNLRMVESSPRDQLLQYLSAEETAILLARRGGMKMVGLGKPININRAVY